MENLLNNHSAMHNYRQSNGLYIISANSVTGYVRERRLLKILKEEINLTTSRAIARKVGISLGRLEDIVEGKVYLFDEKALAEAIETYEDSGIIACLKYMNKVRLKEASIPKSI